MTLVSMPKQAAENDEVVDRGGYRLALRPVAAGWRTAVADEAASWLREKGVDLDLTRDARASVDGRLVRAMHHRNSGIDAFLLSMTETNDGGTFVTTVLAIDDPVDPWLMVRVARDRPGLVPAPRLAGRLLERIEMHDGRHPLAASPQLVHPGALNDFVERLTDPKRRGVVLAIGCGDTITPALITPKLTAWTRNTVGLAATFVLTPDATTEFARLAGSYRVPEGTIRTFRRGVELAEQSLSRTHRMLSPRTVAGSEDWRVRKLLTSFVRTPLSVQALPSNLARWDRTFDRLLNREMTSRIVVARPRPSGRAVTQETAELERVRMVLGVPDLADTTLTELVEAATAPVVDQAAVDAIDDKLQDLQSEKESLEDELDASRKAEWRAREEAVEADERAAEASLALRRLQRLLRERDLDPWSMETEADRLVPDAPGPPGSWSDLADRVGEWSEFGVVVTADDRCVREMDDIDEDGRALNAVHDALSALAGYVRARRSGDHEQDFGRYLETQPAGYAMYPPGRFAPTETGWTKQHYGHERARPVPTWVKSAGIATMNAHLRLTRIPNKDPRVYFLEAVDPAGRFVVIVGYIGPHLTNRATSSAN